MAQQNRREIELALEITTANAEAIGKLRDDVKDLARSGGEAAPEFKRLADQLSALEAQARQLEAIGNLAHDLREVKTAQDAATAATAQARTVLDGYRANVEQVRAAEGAKNLEIRESIAAAQQASAQMRELRTTTDAAGRTAFDYTNQMRALAQTEREAREAAASGRVERERLKVALREGNAALAEAGRAYREAKTGSDAYDASVRGLEQTIDRKNRALVEAGGQSIKLGDSQQRLASDLTRVKEALTGQIEEINRKQRADREAAAEAERLATKELATRQQLQAQARAEADGIIRDYQRMEQAQREAAQAAQVAGQNIRDAFGTVGAKSAQELRIEIQRVRDAMELLQSTGAVTGAELDAAMRSAEARVQALEREVREATGSLTMMDNATGLLQTTVGQLAAFFSFVEVVQMMARAFWNANTQIEALRLGLTTIYGSAETAASQIELLRDAANAGGVAMGDISQAFVKFAASAESSGIPLETTNALFKSLTLAAGTLGLSSAQTERALEALSQMAGKGVVNMEELRQQLGDALPGALALTAKGLGITQQELFKLVESGMLTARDLFPALTKALQDVSGEVNTLSANWARLRNDITLAFQLMGDAGAANVMKTGLQGTSFVVEQSTEALALMGEMLRLSIKEIGLLGKSGDELTIALKQMQVETDAANARMVAIREAFTGGSEAARLMQAATEGNTAALQGVGLSANSAGAAWVQLGVGVAKANEVLALATRMAVESAKAVQIEGEARMTIATLTQSQTEVMQTQIAVAEKNAIKLHEVAAARQAEIQALQLQLEAAKLIAAVNEQEQQARAASIVGLQQQIDTRIAAAQSATQEALAAEASASAARITAQAHADNSARLAELAEAYEAARQALQLMAAQESQGLVTKEELRVQTTRTAEAQALHNDALRDTEALTRAVTQAEQAALSLRASDLRVKEAALQAEIQIARAKGDSNQVARLQTELTRLQIEQSRLLAEAKRAEAASTRAAAEATRANAIALQQWTPAAQAAFRAAMAKANAMENEARIADITARKLRELADATSQAGGEAARASGNYDRFSASLDRTAQTSQRTRRAVAESQEAPQAAAAGGQERQGSGGVGIPVGIQRAQLAGLQRREREGTLTAEDLEFVREQLDVDTANTNAARAGGMLKFAMQLQEAQDQTRDMYVRVKNALEGRGAQTAAPSGAQAGPQFPSAPTLPAPPAPTPITVNLNGTSTRFNMATAQDAAALQGLLTQLATQSARATI